MVNKNIEENWNAVYNNEDKLIHELDSEDKHPISEMYWFSVINNILIKRYGNFDNLKSVELGSGTGKISLAFAKLGVETVLIDSSKEALSLSRKIFEKNLTKDQMKKVHFINGDIIDIKFLQNIANHFNQFDFSISSGVAEHFVGKDRKEVVLNHLRLLKNGGLAFIAVPNHQSPHYWIHRKICEARGGMLCEETPFSKSEMKYILGKNNYKTIKTFGNSIVADLIWLFYPLSILSTLIGFNKSTNIHKKIHKIEEDIMYFFYRRKDYVGNFIGYGFIVIAEKS